MAGERPTDLSRLSELRPAERRAQALKIGLAPDAYKDDYNFYVRVLTTPYPTSQYSMREYAAAISAPRTGGSNPSEYDKQLLKSFCFKGRIQSTRTIPSPHLNLPDPDDPLLWNADCERQLAILMHTSFIASNGWQGDMPVIGDIVKVELQPGAFSFNLQRATFQKIHIESGLGDMVGFGGGSATSAFGNNDIGGTVGQTAYRQGNRTLSILPSGSLSGSQIHGTILPVHTKVTSPYKKGRVNPVSGKVRDHTGIDFSGGRRSVAASRAEDNVPQWKVAVNKPDQEPCYAILDGIVAKASIKLKVSKCPGYYEGIKTDRPDCVGFGGSVWIKTIIKDISGKRRTIYHGYGHIESSPWVGKVGKSISQGEVVGNIGAQGSSTGPHLHFEVRENKYSASKYAKSPGDLFGWYFNPKSGAATATSKLTEESEKPQDLPQDEEAGESYRPEYEDEQHGESLVFEDEVVTDADLTMRTEEAYNEYTDWESDEAFGVSTP